MQRVYTDDRFPECKIVNDGSVVFRVYFQDKLLQTFETWDSTQSNTDGVSEVAAARRAEEYFDRWSKMDTGNDTSFIRHDVPVPANGDEVEPPENVTGTIDDMMAKERLERNPGRKQALRRQLMHLMQHEGSVAAAVVNELIAG